MDRFAAVPAEVAHDWFVDGMCGVPFAAAGVGLVALGAFAAPRLSQLKPVSALPFVRDFPLHCTHLFRRGRRAWTPGRQRLTNAA